MSSGDRSWLSIRAQQVGMLLLIVASQLIVGCARTHDVRGMLKLRPVVSTGETKTVRLVAHERVSIELESELARPGVTAVLALARGGKERVQLPLRLVDGYWSTSTTLNDPGTYVLTVHAFEQKQIYVAALDVAVIAPANRLPRASVTVPISLITFRTSSDVEISPWWGVAAMLVLVALVFGVFARVNRRSAK